MEKAGSTNPLYKEVITGMRISVLHKFIIRVIHALPSIILSAGWYVCHSHISYFLYVTPPTYRTATLIYCTVLQKGIVQYEKSYVNWQYVYVGHPVEIPQLSAGC